MQVIPRINLSNSVWFQALFGICANLLIFAGPEAINAIFSIGAIAQYVAFVLPIAIRVIFVRDNFRPGPWHLGKWSRPVGFIGFAWVALILPILCFPSVKGADLTPSSMNWTCLVYGGPMLLALCWYAIDARKWFKGPKVYCFKCR
jgi:amino acid transporter